MPHKKNPVRCERISGLARIVKSSVQTALENIPSWHERDISHSSAERIILPDAFITTDFLLSEASSIIENWKVNTDNMARNIDHTGGLVFSQAVMLALTEKGLSREDAYHLVQRNSMAAWEGGGDFKTLLKKDKEISGQMSAEEIENCFSLDPYLGKIDYIFARVFTDES